MKDNTTSSEILVSLATKTAFFWFRLNIICNDTLASLACRELLVNFTWSNETGHLRIHFDELLRHIYQYCI